jgi:hypothetical protein
MGETIVILFVIVWLMGMISSYTMGGLIRPAGAGCPRGPRIIHGRRAL